MRLWASGRRLSVRRLWCPLLDKGNLAGCCIAAGSNRPCLLDLSFSALRSSQTMCETAVWSVCEICSLLEDGSHSDHTQGRFSHHKGAPEKRLTHSLCICSLYESVVSLCLYLYWFKTVFRQNFFPSLLTFALVLAHGVIWSFFSSLSYSAFLSNPLPSFLSARTHSDSNVLAPALCFSMVLAVECVPIKGDIYIYLLSGRERRPSLLCDTDWREELRLNTSSQRHYLTAVTLGAGTISEIFTVKPSSGKSYNNMTAAVGSLQVKVLLRKWVW